jgi:putative transposase
MKLKGCRNKKVLMPHEKGSMVAYMITKHKISQRQDCKAISLPQSTDCYQAKEKQDGEVINELQSVVENILLLRFWQSYYRLRRNGFAWNHKRVYRVYTDLHLNIRRRSKKKLSAIVKQALYQQEGKNVVWSVDFMNDALGDGENSGYSI